ncbi:MAG: hypothetical protein Q4D29_07655 [Lachnospiraceae bacterium]|nr:hypothetical protein [Lachnospiraceae bacterium]
MYKNWYGCDAAFFTMAGRGIKYGWVPYRDFFDLKGPYFFFLEALGQLLYEGRTGAFIIQVFALFFALILIIKTCRLFVSTKKTAFIVGLILTFYASTLWGGNTLEEYALPLILLTYYVVLRDIQRSESGKYLSDNESREIASSTLRPLSSLTVGICFGILVFAKITVASPIVGLVLAVIFIYIKNRRFLELVEFLLYSFLGILLAATPIFIYFFCHGMLSRMIYAVFQFAFLRSIDFGTEFSLMWELKISGCYFAIIFAICQLLPKRGADGKFHKYNTFDAAAPLEVGKNNKSGSASLCKPILLFTALFSGVVTALTLHLGDPFIYYFTTVYPILMTALIAMFTIYDPLILFRKWRLDIPILALLVFIGYFAGHTGNQLHTVLYDRGNTYYQTYVDQANEMAALIPECDRDSVYSINMDMQWFECNNILPCYSYTINCQFFCALDPSIREDIVNKIKNDPPKWIVIGGDPSSYIPEVYDEVAPKYNNIYQNDYGALYLLQ